MLGRFLPELHRAVDVRIAIDGSVGIGTGGLGVGIEGVKRHMIRLSLRISGCAVSLEVDVVHVIFMRKGGGFRSGGAVGVVLASWLARPCLHLKINYYKSLAQPF